MPRKVMSYSRLEYIAGAPQVKISRFKAGAGEYDFGMKVIPQGSCYLKQEALEAARVVANSLLEKKLGENTYVLHVRVYPHIITREHRMLGQAGADRISQGMVRAFGKPTGRKAKLAKGQTIIEAFANHENESVVKAALTAGLYKLPIKCSLEVITREGDKK
jgi:large subunit ribosomal protein L10e